MSSSQNDPRCEECGRVECRCAGHIPPPGLAFALPPKADPAELLRQSADLFEERNKQYGANYKQFGEALLLLFPDRTLPKMTMPDDANRLNLTMMCLAKLQRYCHQWDQPSTDNCRDLQVYAAMLEELTKP